MWLHCILTCCRQTYVNHSLILCPRSPLPSPVRTLWWGQSTWSLTSLRLVHRKNKPCTHSFSSSSFYCCSFSFYLLFTSFMSLFSSFCFSSSLSPTSPDALWGATAAAAESEGRREWPVIRGGKTTRSKTKSHWHHTTEVLHQGGVGNSVHVALYM